MGRGGSFNIADTAIQLGALIAMFAAERARKAAERAGQRESGWPVQDKGF